MANDERFAQQIRFIVEIDKLKRVLRRTLLTDKSRRENSAEHSWHIALMAPILAEYAAEDVDILRVVKMLLVHDLVEIDAGDTFAYDAAGNADKVERESAAARRVFGLLPEEQASEFRQLWNEFEEGTSPEARFALALDRFQPLLQNVHADGGTWRSYGVTREQVLDRMTPVRNLSVFLWDYVVEAIDTVWIKGEIRNIED
ncbi:MAG: HD domain-containing protein [Longimicrobiales bacterium]